MMLDIFKTVLLCDHVVLDVQNKHSVIGIYSGDLVVSDLPANLRLSLFMIFVPEREGDNAIELEFFLNESAAAKAVTKVKVKKAGVPTPIVLSYFEVNIAENTQLRLSAKVNDMEIGTILEKEIYVLKGAESAASPSTSRQTVHADLKQA